MKRASVYGFVAVLCCAVAAHFLGADGLSETLGNVAFLLLVVAVLSDGITGFVARIVSRRRHIRRGTDPVRSINPKDSVEIPAVD